MVVRFPVRMTPWFDDVIQQRCDFADWTVFRADGARAPCASLLEQFAPRGTSLDDLCDAESFRGRLIWVEGLNRDNWPEYREFLCDYARFSRNIGRMERARFLVLLVGGPPEEGPQRDVTLEVHDWRGAVKEMDLLVLAYDRIGAWGVSEGIRMLLATIVARVSDWDLGVAERLLDVQAEENLLDPTKILRAMAEEEGWTQRTPEDWGLGTASGSGSVHAALAAVSKPRELQRRIWSAQASVLLPVIDAQRHDVLREQERRVARHLRDDDDLRDPYSVEIGELADLARKLELGRVLCRRLDRLRSARNALAHLEPLRWETVRTLMGA